MILLKRDCLSLNGFISHSVAPSVIRFLAGPFRLDVLQEHAGRLIAWVLGDELALEGALEDGLAEEANSHKAVIYGFVLLIG